MTAENESSTGTTQTSNRSAWASDAWAAFKDLATVFSFIVNFVLVIVVLLLVGWILFPTKTDVVEPMLDDLQSAVTALDNATIYRTIQIDEQVPVNFTLPVKQLTTSGGGAINGTVSLSLPKGME
jgi:hypothetical protein